MNQLITTLPEPQLISFIAALLYPHIPDRSGKTAVSEAMELIAEAVAQGDDCKTIAGMIEAKKPGFQAEREAMQAAFEEEMKAKIRAEAAGLQIPVGPVNPKLLERNLKGQA